MRTDRQTDTNKGILVTGSVDVVVVVVIYEALFTSGNECLFVFARQSRAAYSLICRRRYVNMYP